MRIVCRLARYEAVFARSRRSLFGIGGHTARGRRLAWLKRLTARRRPATKRLRQYILSTLRKTRSCHAATQNQAAHHENGSFYEWRHKDILLDSAVLGRVPGTGVAVFELMRLVPDTLQAQPRRSAIREVGAGYMCLFLRTLAVMAAPPSDARRHIKKKHPFFSIRIRVFVVGTGFRGVSNRGFSIRKFAFFRLENSVVVRVLRSKL